MTIIGILSARVHAKTIELRPVVIEQNEEIAMKLTAGKLAGLKAVSDERGVIAAAAMDQRGSLQKALAKERGGVVHAEDLAEFKTLVTDVLTRHASAIL